MNAHTLHTLHTLHLAAIVRTALCSGDTGNLACVHLTVGPNGGMMEATDGTIAYRERFPLDNPATDQEAIDVCISMDGIKALKAWTKCLPKSHHGHLVTVLLSGKVLHLTTGANSCAIGLMDVDFPSAPIAQALNAPVSTIGISETGLNLEQLSRAHRSLDCDMVRMTWTGRAFILAPLSEGVDKAALVMLIPLAPRV